MALPNTSVPKIIIAEKNLEARIRLPELDEGEHYTTSYLYDVLRLNGITRGIDEKALQEIEKDDLWNEDVVIARGIAPTDGKEGYYEYKVNTTADKAPKILADGSVDYHSMYSIHAVKKGDTIAVYHPAIPGKDGEDIYGNRISAKPGKELPYLRGSGFERADDEVTYVASMDGKIEVQDGKIRILTIYEMSDDLNQTTGDVDFSGDVVIHGGVQSGVSIKAGGSVTIDGVVEGCRIEAGKDIILRKGMIGGNGEAFVKTKGNLFAQFIEHTTLEVHGNIEADVLLSCKVTCRGSILLQGKRASIIGGEVHAVQGIKTTNIGNDAETKTCVFVGASTEDVTRLKKLEKDTGTVRDELERIEQALGKFELLEKQQGVSYQTDPRRLALLRTKIRDTALLAGNEAEVKKLQRLVSSGKNATVCVMRQVFAGTMIVIREERLNVQNNAKGVEFYYHEGGIRTRAPLG